MLITEFEERTGIFPPLHLYKVIEDMYMASPDDKDTFCNNFKKNMDGVAEKAAREAFINVSKIIKDKDIQIAALEKQVCQLSQKLKAEEEWMPYVDKNVSDDQYNELLGSEISLFWKEADVIDYISKYFGFDRSRIKLVTSVPVYERNRHGLLRKVSNKIRFPLYASSDWNYARFDCADEKWELVNGELEKYR